MPVTNKNISSVLRLLKKALKGFPDPSVTLVGKRWGDPFLVLISCLLSLRTQDRTTLPAAERLFALADNPAAMLKISIARIQKAIYPVGFYKTKARRIHEICRGLLERYGGKVPADIDELLTLNGVGRKTANLVLTEGFHKPGICVDTHVQRISNRFGYVQTTTALETEKTLRKKLPKRFWIEYNATLVLWGQNVCRPISPLCSCCVVNKFCAKVGVAMHR